MTATREPLVVLTFEAPTRPLSINRTASMHWASRSRALKPWKTATWAHARNWRIRTRPKAVPVEVAVSLPFRKGARRDPHNYTGTVVKAIIDGLTEAGIVPDDTAQWVRVRDPELVVVRDPGTPLTATVTLYPLED